MCGVSPQYDFIIVNSNLDKRHKPKNILVIRQPL